VTAQIANNNLSIKAEGEQDWGEHREKMFLEIDREARDFENFFV